MDLSAGGKRPRPRVALVGAFGLADLKIFRRMFPTIWQAASIQEMVGRVDKREVDLLVIGTDFNILSGDAKITYKLTDEWLSNCHVICFSENILVFPGPVEGSFILASGKAQGEEFILPELPLPLDRCRKADFSKLESVRVWLRLSLHFNPPVAYHASEMGKIKKIFEQGTIVAERITGSTLAVTFQRKENKLGVAWLPNNIYGQSKWVEALVSEWAKTDTKRFPNFGDWTSSPEWMTPQELKIVGEIETLKEAKKISLINLIKK